MPAKIDGQMMQCCSTPNSSDELVKSSYVTGITGDGAVNGYSTCYDPGTCSTDRSGNSIYACFPSVGEQISNCRPSCLNGHPQGYSRTLYDSDHQMQTNDMPIAERGVELYENYGLTTDIRQDSARFGNDSRSTTKDQMTCATDLGRKISLFGNVDFYIECNKGNFSSISGVTNIGVDKVITLGAVDIVYTLTVWTDFSDYNSMTRYRYFGNHGITFEYAGQRFSYIHGEMYDLPEVGYTQNEDSTIYYISAWQIMRNYFGLADNYITPESLKMVNGNVQTAINSPGYDSSCSGWNFKTANGGAAIFPLPWSHSYFNNYSSTDNSARNCAVPQHNYNTPTNPFNCYGTGIKSFYIPPHMMINGFTYYNNQTSNYGTPQYVPAQLKSEDSLYRNGVFPAYGLTSISNIPNSSAIAANRNSPVNIPAGCICAVYARVRQDDNFYNMYVKPASKFAPEIMLIPGINIAASFAGSLSATGVKSKLGNPLQLIKNPNDFWSSKNPYWQSGKVTLNTMYTPGEVLYGATDLPPSPSPGNYNSNMAVDDDGNVTCKSGFTDGKVDLKTSNVPSIRKNIGRISGTANAAISKIASHFNATIRKTPISLVVDTSVDAPMGDYRVEQFDVMNGVYSLEWLYVLYYCSMNGRKVTYNADTEQYETTTCTPNSTNGCGLQCMLYRDDYMYGRGTSVCPADFVMGNYCGLRNLSAAYSYWQQGTSLLTNDCSCLTQKSYCPAQFNSGCSKDSTNTATYVTAEMADCTEGSSICSYCTITTNQVINTMASCDTDSNNTLVSLGDQCSNNTTNCSTSGTSSTASDTSDDSSSSSASTSHYWILLLIIIVAAVVMLFVGKKLFDRMNKSV
jgi:hypothetical protein